jgi:Kef-type K+ transport system membrane component KefB
MQDIQQGLVQLFVIFLAGQLGAEIALRLKMPPVIGEILGGIAIGPFALGLIEFTDGHAALPFEMLA